MPFSFLTTLALVTPCYCDLTGWKYDSVASSTEEKKSLLAVSKEDVVDSSAIAPNLVKHPAVTEVQFLTVESLTAKGFIAAEWGAVETLGKRDLDILSAENSQVKKTVVLGPDSQHYPVMAGSESAEDETIKNIIIVTDATGEDEILISLSDSDWLAHRELPLQPRQSSTQMFNLPDRSPVVTTEESASDGATERTDATSVGVLAQATLEPREEDVPSDAAVLEDPEGLVVGLDDLLPPPIPLGEARAELLEILGLDSQLPKDVEPVSKEVPPWAVTTYAGRFTSDDLGPALIGNLSGFEDSALFGFGVARTIAGRRPLSLELDGQILQHFGNQGHSEGTVAIVARWHNFPWNDKIDTTFAVGEGLSFATSVPELEINRNGRSTQLLNYLLFEVTFALPQEPDWQVVGRLHHRSGVFGVFDGVGSGSNIYVAGLRRRF